MPKQTLVGQGHQIIEASRSHSDSPHLLRLLWKRNWPVTETSTCRDTTLKSDRRHATGEIRTRSPKKQATAVTRLRRTVHWARLIEDI
jgi:hypothetical protein